MKGSRIGAVDQIKKRRKPQEDVRGLGHGLIEHTCTAADHGDQFKAAGGPSQHRRAAFPALNRAPQRDQTQAAFEDDASALTRALASAPAYDVKRFAGLRLVPACKWLGKLVGNRTGKACDCNIKAQTPFQPGAVTIVQGVRDK